MEDKNKINEENEFYLSELAQWERPFIELDRFFEANKRIDITMDQFEESVRLKDVYDKLFRYMCLINSVGKFLLIGSVQLLNKIIFPANKMPVKSLSVESQNTNRTSLIKLPHL